MIDYAELMRCLSAPRPNGSAAERATSRELQRRLADLGIPCRVQPFRLYPYFAEAIGLWLIVSRTLLVVSVWQRWGWPSLPIALVGLLGGMLDVAGIPVVTWPGARRGENLLVEFDPPRGEGDAPAAQEIIVSAHYDSKTELLDHDRRAFFLRNVRLGIVLTLALGFLGPIDGLLRAAAPAWATTAFGLGATLSLPLIFLAWGLGLNLSLGRFVAPSLGAVDNGAACAILIGLAQRLARGDPQLGRTRVTLALFAGEEVNMQGSRAYARGRDWPRPAAALNLETMAQDGDYVLWQRDGNALGSMPTTPGLNAALAGVVREATGCPARFVDLINSDGFSFLSMGIPASVLGTHHRSLGGGGLHRPSDNMSRVVMSRIPEAVEILARFLETCDRESSALSRRARALPDHRLQPGPGISLHLEDAPWLMERVWQAERVEQFETSVSERTAPRFASP